MSFWLTREINDPNAQAEEAGGVFTLGGTNSTLFTGDIEFLNMPNTTPSFWLLQLSSKWIYFWLLRFFALIFSFLIDKFLFSTIRCDCWW